MLQAHGHQRKMLVPPRNHQRASWTGSARPRRASTFTMGTFKLAAMCCALLLLGSSPILAQLIIFRRGLTLRFCYPAFCWAPPALVGPRAGQHQSRLLRPQNLGSCSSVTPEFLSNERVMTSTASLVALYTEGASTTCSRLKRTRTENQVTVKELEAIG